MQTFLIAAGAITLGEIGDKTQLLSLMLAAKYRKPWPIAFGILMATLANHALAASIGTLVARWLTPEILRWTVGLGLLAVAAWTLVPDKLDEHEGSSRSRHGVWMTTTFTFFLAEMGDKTQFATAVLAADYHPLWQVIAGTTTGMLIADLPVVWLGTRCASSLPLKATRLAAAALFAALGLWVLLR